METRHGTPLAMTPTLATMKFAAVMALVTVVIIAGAPGARASEGCQNAALRAANRSKALPDCRAYERVSPGEKNGVDIYDGVSQGERPTSNDSQAALDGGLIAYAAPGGFAGTLAYGSSLQDYYRGSLAPSGWLTTPLNPPFIQEGAFRTAEPRAYSENLSETIVDTDDPLVAGAASEGIDDLYRYSGTGYELVSPAPPSSEEEAARSDRSGYVTYEGGTPNLSHVLFQAYASIAPDAPTGGVGNLYEWSDGAVKLVSVLPDKTAAAAGAVAGGLVGPHSNYTSDISEDGSHVFFTAVSDSAVNSGTKQVFVREGGERTIEISASQRTTPDPNGPQPAIYMGASADGSRVFFLSAAELTNASMTGASDAGDDLYEYNLETEKLKDLSVDTTVGDESYGASVKGVLGISERGNYIYFVALGQLVAGQGKSAEEAKNQNSQNLYVSHEGSINYVGQLYGGDEAEWASGQPMGRITPSGEYFVYTAELVVPSGEETIREPAQILEYSAAAKNTVCISCDPTGQPSSETAILPGATSFHLPRDLNASGGRIFFDSKEALVSQDTNGQWDVYEWERDGEGTCASESDAGGCLYLISSGTSSDVSSFQDATANGDEVFLVTRSQLIPDDEDESMDMYDAVVGGGLSVPTTNTPCSGEACQGGYTGQSIFSPPSSTLDLSGGNLPTPAEPAPETKKQGKKTRAQKLKAAMKKCRQHKGTKRRACEKAARKRFGPKTAA